MRALSLKGEIPQHLEPEFGISVNVADLTAPEFLWNRRVMRLSQGITVAAVAGQFSQAGFMPTAAAARTLAVVESLIITNTAAGGASVLVDSQPTTVLPFAAGTPRSSLDDRAIPFNQLQPAPSFGLVSATAVAPLTGLGAIVVTLPSVSTFILPLNWVFTARTVLTTPAPSALLVQASAVNTVLQFAVVWRERTLLASEAT